MILDEERPVQFLIEFPENVVAVLVAQDSGDEVRVLLAIVSCSLPLSPSDGRRTGLSKIRAIGLGEMDCWLQSYSSGSGCGMLFDDQERIRFVEPGLDSLLHLRTKYCRAPSWWQNLFAYFVYADDCEVPEAIDAWPDRIGKALRLLELVGE